MSLRLIASALVLLTAPAALASEDSFDKRLSVNGAPTLTVATGSGFIHVNPGPDDQIHVVGRVRSNHGLFGGNSGSEARVKEIAANPPIVQTGNTITIGHTGTSWSNFQNISIDYEVTVPKSSTLKATTGSGDLEVAGVEGTLTAQSGSGDVHVDNIGSNSKLGTGSGTIRATNVHGSSSLETGSGDIHLQELSAGDVQATTGSGSIRIQGITGRLRAGTGSGNIEVSGTPTSDWKLDTGSGSVRLALGSGAKFQLDAGTGSGSVKIQQPIMMHGTLNRHHVTGSVNGGGPTVKAETGSGDISIE